MIYLQPDTPNQVAFMTLSEGRNSLPSSYSDYLMVLRHMGNGTMHYIILGIVSENDKWSQVTIDTTGITLSGDYEYQVYAQNSPSNIDIGDASVVGEVERGIINLASSITYIESPTIVIPENVER